MEERENSNLKRAGSIPVMGGHHFSLLSKNTMDKFYYTTETIKQDVLNEYVKRLAYINIRGHRYEFILLAINTFHILLYLFIVIGLFFPPKYLSCVLIVTLILLFSWIFIGRCIINQIEVYIYSLDSRFKIDDDILNRNGDIPPILYFLILIVIAIIIIGITYPNLSPFRILLRFINLISIKFDN